MEGAWPPPHKAATKLLLDFGAHLDQPDANGITPLNMVKLAQVYLFKKEGCPDPYFEFSV